MSYWLTSPVGLGDDSSDGGLTAAQGSSILTNLNNLFATATSSAPTSTKIEGSISSALAAAGSIPSPATPFLEAGAAIAGLLAKYGVGSGCGQSCVLSTQYANAAESALQQNYKAYFAIPAPRWTGYQQQALANFAAVWNDLVSQCSNPALGDAGKRCISDRQSGSCVWKNADGSCFNWWAGYHDPIANDTNTTDVQPSTFNSSAQNLSNVGSSLTAATGGISPLLLITAAAVLVLVVVNK